MTISACVSSRCISSASGSAGKPEIAHGLGLACPAVGYFGELSRGQGSVAAALPRGAGRGTICRGKMDAGRRPKPCSQESLTSNRKKLSALQESDCLLWLEDRRKAGKRIGGKYMNTKIAVALASALSLSGCGTILTGTTEPISINSDPPGATVTFFHTGDHA